MRFLGFRLDIGHLAIETGKVWVKLQCFMCCVFFQFEATVDPGQDRKIEVDRIMGSFDKLPRGTHGAGYSRQNLIELATIDQGEILPLLVGHSTSDSLDIQNLQKLSGFFR